MKPKIGICMVILVLMIQAGCGISIIHVDRIDFIQFKGNSIFLPPLVLERIFGDARPANSTSVTTAILNDVLTSGREEARNSHMLMSM